MVTYFGNISSALPVWVSVSLLTVLGICIHHQEGVEKIMSTCAGSQLAFSKQLQKVIAKLLKYQSW